MAPARGREERKGSDMDEDAGRTAVTRVHAEVPGWMRGVLERGLAKDLCEGEEVCGRCGGTGLALAENRYGISGDPPGPPSPYLHESLTFCPSCYNGVVVRCPECGEQLPKGVVKCPCCRPRDLEEGRRLGWERALKVSASEYAGPVYDCRSGRYCMEGPAALVEELGEAPGWGGLLRERRTEPAARGLARGYARGKRRGGRGLQG